MVNKEEGKQAEKPVLALAIIITISSNNDSRSSSSTTTITVGRTITGVPMTSGMSERMPWVA